MQNSLKKERQTAEHVVETAKGAVNATIQEQSFQEDKVLQFVNQNRIVVGGQEISTLHFKELKTGLTPPNQISKEKIVNVALVERDIQNLQNVTLVQNQTEIRERDKELREVITTIRSDPQLLQALNRQQLTELGISMIDESGRCPLCDTPWPEGELYEYLEQRLSSSEKASQYKKAISDFSTFIAGHVNNTLGSLQKIIETLQITGDEEEGAELTLWFNELEKLSSTALC